MIPAYVNPQPMGYERPNLEQPVPVVMQAPTQPLPVINNEIVVNGTFMVLDKGTIISRN